jgi:hypothetical protein
MKKKKKNKILPYIKQNIKYFEYLSTLSAAFYASLIRMELCYT